MVWHSLNYILLLFFFPPLTKQFIFCLNAIHHFGTRPPFSLCRFFACWRMCATRVCVCARLLQEKPGQIPRCRCNACFVLITHACTHNGNLQHKGVGDGTPASSSSVEEQNTLSALFAPTVIGTGWDDAMPNEADSNSGRTVMNGRVIKRHQRHESQAEALGFHSQRWGLDNTAGELTDKDGRPLTSTLCSCSSVPASGRCIKFSAWPLSLLLYQPAERIIETTCSVREMSRPYVKQRYNSLLITDTKPTWGANRHRLVKYV